VSTFSILGIRPQIGRVFTADDELNPDGDPRVALLSDGYWRRRFGADPNVVGKRIPYGDRSVQIIGVLPPNASLPDAKADIWIRNHPRRHGEAAEQSHASRNRAAQSRRHGRRWRRPTCASSSARCKRSIRTSIAKDF
jgi:hypothetical protein